MKYSLSAVILAGGEGRRIGGKPKTELLVGGEKIISRMLKVLREIFDEIIIVTNSPERFSDLKDCRIITDLYPGSGPLGGIHAAMNASVREALFVFGGDMPFLDKTMINRQIEEYFSGSYSTLIPVVDNLGEPLHGIYSNSIVDKVELILTGTKTPAVKDLFMKINTRYMKLPSSSQVLKAFTNINSLSDLVQAENFYL